MEVGEKLLKDSLKTKVHGQACPHRSENQSFHCQVHGCFVFPGKSGTSLICKRSKDSSPLGGPRNSVFVFSQQMHFWEFHLISVQCEYVCMFMWFGHAYPCSCLCNCAPLREGVHRPIVLLQHYATVRRIHLDNNKPLDVYTESKGCSETEREKFPEKQMKCLRM